MLDDADLERELRERRLGVVLTLIVDVRDGEPLLAGRHDRMIDRLRVSSDPDGGTVRMTESLGDGLAGFARQPAPVEASATQRQLRH